MNNDNNSPGRYIHQTVNHPINFVDPTTLVHTQYMQEYVDGRRNEERYQIDQHLSLLCTHLSEFMWRHKFGGRPFENLIRMVQEQYQLV